MYHLARLEQPVVDYRGWDHPPAATVAANALYRPSGPDFVARFYSFKNEWRRQTLFSSSLNEMVDVLPMQQIIGMGFAAVPLIIEDIKVDPGFLYLALPQIFGVDPIPDCLNGDPFAICEAWIEWVEQNHLDAG
jgi:hypothetical protein